MCLVLMTGCQRATVIPVSPSFASPAASATSVPERPVDTQTSSPTYQAATSTPTVVAILKDEPIALIGRLIDGTGAEPLEDGVIIIQAGTITAVGTRQEVAIPTNANILEFTGATILPGFINAHVHSTYQADYLEMWAQAGVTTVRDLGAKFPFYRWYLRDQYNQDATLATLISAGPLITVPGGYPQVGSNFPSLLITNPDQARRAIAELISDGADVIKIVVDSGEGLPTLSLEEATAIVETAHQYGVPVAAHIGSLSNLRLVVNAGVDDFSHIVPEPIPEDVLAQIITNDIYWVPTLETAGGYDAGNLRTFVAAGGHVALGNDSGLLEGMEMGMPLREILMMQAAGMTPMEIIVAATKNAAHVCNRDDTLGTLEVGKTADILVVNGDPLENLQVLKDVLMVIHQGVIIRDATQK